MAKKKGPQKADDDIPYEEFSKLIGANMPLTKFSQSLRREHDPERPVTSALRRAIAETGLNSVQIAERTGLSKQAVFRFLTGEREATTSTIDRICTGLDLEVSIQPRRKATG